MSLISKSTTFKSGVSKDKPTARVPLRGNYTTWKETKKDALITRPESRSIGSIQKDNVGLSSELSKYSNLHSLHQSAKVPCIVKRSTYSSVKVTKSVPSTYSSVAVTNTIPSIVNPKINKVPLSVSSNQKTLNKNKDGPTARPALRDFPLDANAFKKTTISQKTVKSTNLSLIGDPFFSTTDEEFLPHITHKSIIDDAKKIVKSKNLSLISEAIFPPTDEEFDEEFLPEITHKSIIDDAKKILKSKNISLIGEAFFPPTDEELDEEFVPDITHKSIIEDTNILKTPVNDSLTRKTILTNVVPVTSLITKTHHYKEHKTISDIPTKRNALRSDIHLTANSLFDLDNSSHPSLVEDSQVLSSTIEENVDNASSYKETEEMSISSLIDQYPTTEFHTPLTSMEVSDLSTGSSQDVLSANKKTQSKEDTIPLNLSRQDTEQFEIPGEDPESSLLSGEKEKQSKIISEDVNESSISNITEIDLTIEDESSNESNSNVINEESLTTDNTILETSNKHKHAFSRTGITVTKENEKSEIQFPSSDIVINLPPLISPMHSDNTKGSDDASFMMPDSTTDFITSTPKIKKFTTHKKRETSLRRKIQSRQTSLKRKLSEVSASRSCCDFEKAKKIKIDKKVMKEPRKIKSTDKKAEGKKMVIKAITEPKKVKSPMRKTESKKSDKQKVVKAKSPIRKTEIKKKVVIARSPMRKTESKKSNKQKVVKVKSPMRKIKSKKSDEKKVVKVTPTKNRKRNSINPRTKLMRSLSYNRLT